MTREFGSSASEHVTITVDEVGIRYAVLGELRLRSNCQPILATANGMITPIGVQMTGAAFRGGKHVSAEDLIKSLDGRERWQVRKIFRRLHLYNLHNVSEAPLGLHLALDCEEGGIEAAARELAELTDAAAGMGIDAGRLVFDLSDIAMHDPGGFQECEAMLGRTGARSALNAAAMSGIGGRISAQPGIVCLPASWLRVLCGDPRSSRLLSTMVASLRRRGITVHADGIASASHLRMAVEARIDFLQGSLFAEPEPAGAAFDEEARALAPLLSGVSELSLFRR